MLIPTCEALSHPELLPIEDWLRLSEHCREKKDLTSATRLCTQIQGNGLLSFEVVGNSLISTFSENGSIGDVYKVFYKQEDHNKQSWTSLIEATAKYGHYKDAFELLQSMQDDGVAPSAYTYLSLVKLCAKLKYEDRGRELHTQIICAGLEANEFLGNAMLDMYAKCGCLADAQNVFDQLSEQTVVSWNSLIAGYGEHGLGERTLQCFEQMQEKGVYASTVTFLLCLKACGTMKAYEKCQGIHAEVVKEGFDDDSFVGSTLVGVYAKCGFLLEAQELFDELAVRDVVSWTALIAGYSEYRCEEQALHLFDRMLVEGIAPSVATYSCAFKLCGCIHAWDRGYELHCEIIKDGLAMNSTVEGSLIDMYAKCGLFEEAEDVLNEVSSRDVVHWTALIAGFAEHGCHEKARNLLKQMQAEGVFPDAITLVSTLKACVDTANLCLGQDIHAEIAKEGAEKDLFVVNKLVDMYAKGGAFLEARDVFDEQKVRDVVTWSALIDGYIEHDLNEEALGCFADMQHEGILPDAYIFASILKACANLGILEMGQVFHAKAVEEELEKDYFLGNILVTMYGKCGSWEEAQDVFDSLQFTDLVSWNALIEFISSNKVFDCLDRMRVQCVAPDALTYVCSLKACKSDMNTGLKIHVEVLKGGFETDIMICNSLVDMYITCGMLSEAEHLFERMSFRDAVTWNTLIAGLVDQGLEESALRYLDQMQAENLSLDVATCISGLNASGNLQAIDKGQELHFEITKEGFDSDSGTCNALIEMYSECGWLMEAQEVFDTLLSKKDIVSSWTSLIKGYSEQENMEMVHYLYKQMQEQGLLPTSVIFRNLLNAYGSLVALEYVTKLDAQLCKPDGIKSLDNRLVSSIINTYLKCGRIVDAHILSATTDLGAWNALITGYVRQGKVDEAFIALKKMEDKSVQPDGITFINLLNACCHGGFVEMGQYYYESMSKEYGITPSVKHHTCMMDLLGRSGRLNEAAKMLEMLPCDEDQVPWSSFLGACKNWGNVELGKHSFEQAMVLHENRSAALMIMGDICANSWAIDSEGVPVPV